MSPSPSGRGVPAPSFPSCTSSPTCPKRVSLDSARVAASTKALRWTKSQCLAFCSAGCSGLRRRASETALVRTVRRAVDALRFSSRRQGRCSETRDVPRSAQASAASRTTCYRGCGMTGARLLLVTSRSSLTPLAGKSERRGARVLWATAKERVRETVSFRAARGRFSSENSGVCTCRGEGA
jgi:hypothetical protein